MQKVCSWRKQFGEKCEYLHKENDTSHDQIKTKERVDKLEQVVRDKVSEEKKMLYAIKELEKMLKAMTRKLIHLEEEVVKMKKDSKENQNNELKETIQNFFRLSQLNPCKCKGKTTSSWDQT